MQLRPPLVAVAVITLVLAVGCVSVPSAVGDGSGHDASLPSGDLSEDVTAPGHSAEVTVNGSLPVDATRTYRRVEQFMNASAPAPTVEVERRDRSLPTDQPLPPARRALGFTNDTGALEECFPLAAASAGSDQVRISPAGPISGEELSPSQIELVLAHEYAHIVQDRVAGFETASDAEDYRVSRAMSEGSAVYVAEAYAQEYDLQWETGTPFAIRECLWEQSRNGMQENSGIYHFGGQYFDERLDDPAELPTVYQDAPNTTEQIIHGETPASEPAAPLDVQGADDEDWERSRGFDAIGGELTVRTWLRTALPADRVDEAASGWGNDVLLVRDDEREPEIDERDPGTDERETRDEEQELRTDERELGNVAWVLRWDSVSDADEFAAAVDDAESTLEDRGGTSLRHVRVDSETVVVFGGEASFVENASASGTNADVTVSAS